MLPEWIRAARCFILDMDGTVFHGNRLLPGAGEFLEFLAAQQIPVYFLTNNSSRTAGDYTEKINPLGPVVRRSQVFTSKEATARDLAKRLPFARVFLAGTPALAGEFRAFGLDLVTEGPDVVVLGFGTTLTYDKLHCLCDYVRAALPFVTTHPYINSPTESGYVPDTGAIIALGQPRCGRFWSFQERHPLTICPANPTSRTWQWKTFARSWPC